MQLIFFKVKTLLNNAFNMQLGMYNSKGTVVYYTLMTDGSKYIEFLEMRFAMKLFKYNYPVQL